MLGLNDFLKIGNSFFNFTCLLGNTQYSTCIHCPKCKCTNEYLENNLLKVNDALNWLQCNVKSIVPQVANELYRRTGIDYTDYLHLTSFSLYIPEYSDEPGINIQYRSSDEFYILVAIGGDKNIYEVKLINKTCSKIN